MARKKPKRHGCVVLETVTPGGGVDITINCACGKPISKTSQQFGMDCEDDCGRKEFESLLETSESAHALHKMFGKL